MTRSPVPPPAKIVKKLTSLIKSGSVLDIGTGRGRHMIYLALKGFDVTALEPSEDYVKKLGRKANERNFSIKIVKQDLLGYKPEKTFCAVVAISVLHFLKNKKEIDEAINKMQAWTKPNGLNAVSVMMNVEVNNPRPYLFSRRELKDYYNDWDVLFYEELLGDFYKPSKGAKPIRSWVARLIARKPG